MLPMSPVLERSTSLWHTGGAIDDSSSAVRVYVCDRVPCAVLLLSPAVLPER